MQFHLKPQRDFQGEGGKVIIKIHMEEWTGWEKQIFEKYK